MNVGIVGLGRMGLGMVGRLAGRGYRVLGYDTNADRRRSAEAVGAGWAESLDVMSSLPKPRVIIVMVPAGDPVQSVMETLAGVCDEGDVVVDGGNSFYKDSMRRAETLRGRGVNMLDVGVSGGVWGAEAGYCLMAGGDADAYAIAEPVLKDLACESCLARVGPSGSGHFAKMVHNGIEYALMEAYGEGFEVLKESQFDYDFAALADLWNHGSVIRSWLLELVADAFRKDGQLDGIRGYVEDTGEGRWTLQESIEERVPAPAIALSLMMRLRSRQDDSFAAKVVAALRQEFGGHPVKPK